MNHNQIIDTIAGFIMISFLLFVMLIVCLP